MTNTEDHTQQLANQLLKELVTTTMLIGAYFNELTIQLSIHNDQKRQAK